MFLNIYIDFCAVIPQRELKTFYDTTDNATDGFMARMLRKIFLRWNLPCVKGSVHLPLSLAPTHKYKMFDEV